MRRVSDLYVPSQRIFAFLTLSVPADHLSHRFCAKVLLSSPRRDLFAMVCRWLDSQPAIDDHPPRSGGAPLRSAIRHCDGLACGAAQGTAISPGAACVFVTVTFGHCAGVVVNGEARRFRCLPTHRFACHGCGYCRRCRERRDSECWPNLRGCFIVGAVLCVESAARTPPRVSCGSSQAFAITTGSSRSRQA
jgi:hypothetical protein